MLSNRPAHSQLQASAGAIDITPKGEVFIAGYESNRKSTGVHDPLWARCIILKNGKESVAFVVADVIGIIRIHVEQIRNMVTKIPRERVLIGATHTHSGPDTYGQWGPKQLISGVDKVWYEETLKRIAAMVDDCAGRLKPAQARFGSTTDVKGVSKNIRIASILDTTLSAMQLMGDDGKTIGTLVNYACHPEAMHNHLITSDFPNWLRTDVEKKLGGVCVYMNGAQGGMVTTDFVDQPKGEAWPEAQRLGETLAAKTIECLTEAKPTGNVPIQFQQKIFRVPLENNNFKLLVKAGVLPRISDGDDVVTEVNRIRIGDAEFITLPGEVLPNIGIYLRKQMTGTTRFQLGLTCDALGYILTPEDFVQKLYSYESSVSVGPKMGRIMEENLIELMRVH